MPRRTRSVKPPKDDPPALTPAVPVRRRKATPPASTARLAELEAECAYLGALYRPARANRHWLRPSMLRMIDRLDDLRRTLTRYLDSLDPARRAAVAGGAG